MQQAPINVLLDKPSLLFIILQSIKHVAIPIKHFTFFAVSTRLAARTGTMSSRRTVQAHILPCQTVVCSCWTLLAAVLTRGVLVLCSRTPMTYTQSWGNVRRQSSY